MNNSRPNLWYLLVSFCSYHFGTMAHKRKTTIQDIRKLKIILKLYRSSNLHRNYLWAFCSCVYLCWCRWCVSIPFNFRFDHFVNMFDNFPVMWTFHRKWILQIYMGIHTGTFSINVRHWLYTSSIRHLFRSIIKQHAQSHILHHLK